MISQFLIFASGKIAWVFSHGSYGVNVAPQRRTFHIPTFQTVRCLCPGVLFWVRFLQHCFHMLSRLCRFCRNQVLRFIPSLEPFHLSKLILVKCHPIGQTEKLFKH